MNTDHNKISSSLINFWLKCIAWTFHNVSPLVSVNYESVPVILQHNRTVIHNRAVYSELGSTMRADQLWRWSLWTTATGWPVCCSAPQHWLILRTVFSFIWPEYSPWRSPDSCWLRVSRKSLCSAPIKAPINTKSSGKCRCFRVYQAFLLTSCLKQPWL